MRLLNFAVLCVAVAWMIAPSAARSDYGEETVVRHPGFARHLGPQEALGVIIWSPGYDFRHNGHPEPLTGYMPHFLDWLYGHGWDVYYMARQGELASGHPLHAAAIRRGVQGLRAAGYRHIVLGGHSTGGTYQMIAASEDLGLHGMMLFAPKPPFSPPTMFDMISGNLSSESDALSFEKLLSNGKAQRLVVAHFNQDNWGDKRDEEALRALLAAKPRPALLIHEPEGHPGHNAALHSRFSRAFGDCILTFLDPTREVAAEITTCP